MSALRDDAIAAVEDAAIEQLQAAGDEIRLPSVEQYVDTVLAVVTTHLSAGVLDLASRGELTPTGARVVHRVLDAAQLTTPPNPGRYSKKTSRRPT